jgi:1,4-dihydroxy-2-naphthoate polyprenyltransferase
VTRGRAWVAAIRPRTLPAAIAPVVVGTAVAARSGHARPSSALAALAAALLLQIGTNLVNDWGDFRRGADGPDRLGPSRVVAAGWLSPGDVIRGASLAFVIAALIGGWLIARGGWPIASIGLAGLAVAIGYTAGPWPLAYHALGEAFVFLFFGPLAVCGTELLQTGRASNMGLLASLPVGLLATAILLVNNVRDVESDRRTGKRTLVVRLGRTAGQALYAGTVAAAFALAAAIALALSTPGPLVAWLSAPLAVAPMRTVLRSRDGPALNAALAATARLHLAFGMLLAGGVVW